MKLIPLRACTTLMTLSLRSPDQKRAEKKKKKNTKCQRRGSNDTWRKKTERGEEKKTRDADEGAQIILWKKNMKSAEKKKYAMRRTGLKWYSAKKKKDAGGTKEKKTAQEGTAIKKQAKQCLIKIKIKSEGASKREEVGSSARERKGARKEGRKDWQKVGMNNPCLIWKNRAKRQKGVDGERWAKISKNVTLSYLRQHSVLDWSPTSILSGPCDACLRGSDETRKVHRGMAADESVSYRCVTVSDHIVSWLWIY